MISKEQIWFFRLKIWSLIILLNEQYIFAWVHFIFPTFYEKALQ